MEAKVVNRENITRHLIEYQLKMIGKTFEEASDEEEWYSNWTFTPEQHEEFKTYTIRTIKKIFKCNRSKAEEAFNWFDISFGLKVKH